MRDTSRSSTRRRSKAPDERSAFSEAEMRSSDPRPYSVPRRRVQSNRFERMRRQLLKAEPRVWREFYSCRVFVSKSSKKSTTIEDADSFVGRRRSSAALADQ